MWSTKGTRHMRQIAKPAAVSEERKGAGAPSRLWPLASLGLGLGPGKQMQPICQGAVGVRVRGRGLSVGSGPVRGRGATGAII
jgi:hypothetical protein